MNSSKNSKKKSPTKPRIIVVLGPTASGKSDLAVKIAKYIGSLKRSDGSFAQAEIISADSRQVYKGLDIGTGKIKKSETHGIRHHLLDVASPKKVFTVADYQKLAKCAFQEIIKRNHTPIICGGTGFYIDALIYDYTLPQVKPNLKLRKRLAGLDVDTLYAMLKKKDPRRARNIDPKNPRRLIRALEIVMSSNKPVPLAPKKESPYDILKLGVSLPPSELQNRIEKRLKKRIGEGLLKEVADLHRHGLSWKRMRDLGLEYRYSADHLTGKVKTQGEFELKLSLEIRKYAKRQMTWFKRDKTIIWTDGKKDTYKIVGRFLK